ncbi:MAG: hypothetical protein FJZ95_09610 [Chloroflexi bacterium]|nr:hypothetical protein [Chloroflexota bacterium]
MGLRDRFKKGTEEKKAEDIGGLVMENQAAYSSGTLSGGASGSSQGTLSPASQGSLGSAGAPAAEKGGGGTTDVGGMANLDIFAQETTGDEGNALAKLLPEVDIQDLLRECQEIADRLREGSE